MIVLCVLCESSSSQTCGPFPCEQISRQDLLGWGQSCLGSFAGALQSAGVNLQGAIVLSCPLLLPSRVNGSSPTCVCNAAVLSCDPTQYVRCFANCNVHDFLFRHKYCCSIYRWTRSHRASTARAAAIRAISSATAAAAAN